MRKEDPAPASPGWWLLPAEELVAPDDEWRDAAHTDAGAWTRELDALDQSSIGYTVAEARDRRGGPRLVWRRRLALR